MGAQTIITITVLALADSVNPCTIAVMALLISAILITKGRRDAILAGVLFTATIYVMYFLYGIGILSIVYASGWEQALKIGLKALLAVMIVAEFFAYVNYTPGFRSMEMPKALRPIAKKALSAVNNPLAAIPVAALCSVLLLPCSSGPYLSAILFLASTHIEKIAYLLYYNAIFVLPMIGITLIVGLGTNPKRVMEWRNRHIRTLHLVAGALLLAVFFMV